jgi:hypothetical protein
MALVQAQANELNARAQESAADAQEAQARAQKLMVEASLLDDKVKADLIRSLTANITTKDKNEFDKRVKTAEMILKEREIDSNEKIVQQQMQLKQNNA